MADKQPPQREGSQEEQRLMITYEPDPSAPKDQQALPEVNAAVYRRYLSSTLTRSSLYTISLHPLICDGGCLQVLRSTMLTSEPAAPALLKKEGSPLQIGGASVRKPIVQPPHELKKEPATTPHTTLPPVTEFEWGSPGTAKTHFKPPTGSGTRSWLSHLSSPYIATPPLAIVTPPKSAATPPLNGMKGTSSALTAEHVSYRVHAVGVLWISALHRDASGFLLQTLSFMHCIGCTLAPILSEPFMTRRSLLQPPSDLPPPVERELAYLTSLEDKDFIYIAYAYWAVGIYVFLIVFLALVAFFVDPRHQDLRPMETQCPAVPISGLVVVLFFYLFLAVAMEIIYSQLIAAFALLLGHNKTVAAYVTSLFWASYSTVRGVSITWLKQHGSFNVLLCSNVFLVAVTAFSSVFGYQTRVMWIGTALAAACMAPVMPSTLLLLHDHSGVSVGRFALAVFTVGVSSAFAPLCLGAKLEREPMLFHYALAALAVLSLLLVFVGRTLVRRTPVEDGYTLLPADRRPSNRSSKLH
ncbi:hypothetical protein V5799_031893 [Amblyomma americanum]|uniref:Uncharacterized protein n=1 Tax=Amblyomma americanum TaxID=6943 RepID=A0AAQ4DSQ7_AMBAM